MAQIDLLLAAELLLVLLLMATMDCHPVHEKVVETPLNEPTPAVDWDAGTDLHAQRILRLERRRLDGAAAPLA
jgi:hypothetical protein